MRILVGMNVVSTLMSYAILMKVVIAARLKMDPIIVIGVLAQEIIVRGEKCGLAVVVVNL